MADDFYASSDPASANYNPLQVRSSSGRALSTGEALATAGSGTIHLGQVMAQSPAIRDWVNSSMKEMGIEQYGPNADFGRMLGAIAPSPRRDYDELPYDLTPNLTGMVQRDRQPFDFVDAVSHGLGSTFLGGLTNAFQLQTASRYQNVPGYDVWQDPQIVAAGLEGQYELFHGSRSPEMTAWLIQRFNTHQRDARRWNDMSGPKEEVAFVAGILGDPLTYLPGTLGVKGAGLGAKSFKGTLSGAERSLVMTRPPIYGTLGDGMRNFAINAAMMQAENSIAQGFDPVDRIDYVANDIILPSAIGASVGMLMGASGRFSARLNTLAQDARRANFLHGTLPQGSRTFEQDLHGARFVAPEFVGPTVPADRAAAERILSQPDLRGDVPSQRIEAAIAEGQVRTPNTMTGSFSPGSLATDYGQLRRDEFNRNAANAPYVTTTPRRLVDMEFKPGELPEAEPPYRGPLRVDEQGNVVPDPRPPVGRKLRAGELEEGPVRDLAREFHEATGKRLVDVEFHGDDPMAEIRRMIAARSAEPPPAPTPVMTPVDRARAAPPIKPRDPASPPSIAEMLPDSAISTIARGLEDSGGEAISIERLHPYIRKELEAAGFASEGTISAEQFQKILEVRRAEMGEGSLSAAITPGSQIYRDDILRAQGRQAPTGIGIENLPTDPWARAAKGASVRMMQLMTDLVSSGGRLTVGNLLGFAPLPPVEKLIDVNWNYPMAQSIRHTADQFSLYRQGLGKVNAPMPADVASLADRGDFNRLREQIGIAAKDKFTRGEKALSFREFRERVGEALRNDDTDFVQDGATRYVEASAAEHRQKYNMTRDKAREVGLFDEVHQKALDHAHSEIAAIKREADEVKRKSAFERWDPERTRQVEEALLARMEDAEFHYGQKKELLDRMRANGPLNSTSPSYRGRMWDAEMLDKDEARAVSIFTGYFQSEAGGGYALPEAARLAKDMHSVLAKQNPIYTRGDVEAAFMSVAGVQVPVGTRAKGLFQSVSGPTAAYGRSFMIPDELVKDYLVKDSEVLMRYHMKQMGTAIEMKTRFGNLDLAEQIAEIEQDYRGMIIKANAGSDVPTDEAKRLTAEMKTAIADAQAVRDKIYGTYGAAADPSRLSSRMIRMAKQYTNLTLLGMSGITALGDVVRPLMTEGIDAMYGMGIRSMMGESRGTIWRMVGHELELMGDGMDMIKNVRALSAADTGDIFGSRGSFERGLSQANNLFFVANGLNAVTDFTKKWAATIIMGRVNSILLDATVDWAIPTGDVGRFAAAGIGAEEAKRIGRQIEIHGKEYGKLVLPNTNAWKGDEEAAILYRQAINQMVNRTVPTPGIGDRPNWMSTEWGSLISQYKSFAVAANVRQLQSGLQEGGNQFWYGAAAMVGFAVLLNEVRSRLFYDKSTFDRPATAVIADAVDRSSILGYFSDVNRAVEALTGNRLGVKPLLGASRPGPVDPARAVGATLGPAAGQAVRAVSVADDTILGHPTAKTFANWRTLVPGNTLPYMDPAMDHLISTGSYHPAARQASQINRTVEQRQRQTRPAPLAPAQAAP